MQGSESLQFAPSGSAKKDSSIDCTPKAIPRKHIKFAKTVAGLQSSSAPALLEPSQAAAAVAYATSPAAGTQRTQYPLIKEYTLNYRGLNIMIYGGIGFSGMDCEWPDDPASP